MEFISLKPKITKDFILSKVNQESIMQHSVLIVKNQY